MRFSGRARLLTLVSCVSTALMCAGLLAAAALVPAPPAALLLIIPICVTVPMLAAWQATVNIASPAGVTPLDKAALSDLRRELDLLPETHHPLGL